MNLVLFIFDFVYRWISTRWAKIIEVMVVCAFTVSTGFVMIYLIDDCKAIGEDKVQYPIQVRFFFLESIAFPED